MRSLTLAALAVAVTVTGCDAGVDKGLFGVKDSAVVISSKPLLLTSSPIALASSEPMRVLGEAAFVCVVLRDGVALDDQRKMDSAFAEAMRGSNVTVVVELGDGTRKKLRAPMFAWSRSGVVLAKNEMSGCASAACESRLPKGSLVTKIEIASSPDLEIKGVYWHSRSDMPTKFQQPPSRSAGSPATSSCGQNRQA